MSLVTHAIPNDLGISIFSMQFPERYSDDDQVATLAWQAYQNYLADSGIDPKSDIYKYFVHDAFHDSEIRVEVNLSLDKCSSYLSMRNVRLLNELDWWHGIRDIQRSDFLTRITMRKCHEINVLPDCTQQFWYHGSEIRRIGTKIALTIATSSRHDLNGVFLDSIRFLADEIEVEDITPRLSHCYGIPQRNIREQLESWTLT